MRSVSEEKRTAILEAATQTFAEKGFHAARISDVAELAGVGKGTVYLYFSSKEDLLLSILQSYVDEALVLADQMTEQGVGLKEGIEQFLERALDRIVENPALFTMMEQRVFLTDPEMQQRGEAFFHSIIGRIVEKLEAVIRQGQIRDYDPTIVACAIIGSLTSLQLYHALHSEREMKALLPRFTRELARFITAALEPDPPAVDSSKPH